jgi:hypothetical protein
MKSEMSFFEKTFWKSSFFLLSKIQHMLFKIYSLLIVMYFENRNWPVVRLKWLFFLFFVSILESDFGYIFLWSMMRWPFLRISKNKKQDAQVKTQALSWKVVSLLSTYLSACIITNSLIHEVTTLMEKLFKFWECHLSVQIVCLIKKSF